MRQCSILNMKDSERTALLMFAMLLQLASYLAWDIFVIQHEAYHPFVDLDVVFSKVRLILLSMAVSVVLMLLAIRQVQRQQFSEHLMVLAVGFYVVDMLLMGWTAGLLTMALGVVLAGATFIGVLMLPPYVVLTAALIAALTIIGLGGATLYYGLPYAPIFKQQLIGEDLQYSKFYFFSQFYFTLPFLMAIVLISHFFLSDWKRREALFKTTSERDSLTQLFNRRIAQERLAAALQESSDRPTSVILMDLDFFKRINDTYGHLIGDQVLQTAASSLQATARQTDMVARFGGEEFLLVLAETSYESALQAAERYRKKIERMIVMADQTQVVTLTASFGVATVLAGHDVSVDFILREADAALYQAKESGRNQVVGRDYSQSGRFTGDSVTHSADFAAK